MQVSSLVTSLCIRSISHRSIRCHLFKIVHFTSHNIRSVVLFLNFWYGKHSTFWVKGSVIECPCKFQAKNLGNDENIHQPSFGTDYNDDIKLWSYCSSLRLKCRHMIRETSYIENHYGLEIYPIQWIIKKLCILVFRHWPYPQPRVYYMWILHGICWL